MNMYFYCSESHKPNEYHVVVWLQVYQYSSSKLWGSHHTLLQGANLMILQTDPLQYHQLLVINIKAYYIICYIASYYCNVDHNINVYYTIIYTHCVDAQFHLHVVTCIAEFKIQLDLLLSFLHHTHTHSCGNCSRM